MIARAAFTGQVWTLTVEHLCIQSPLLWPNQESKLEYHVIVSAKTARSGPSCSSYAISNESRLACQQIEINFRHTNGICFSGFGSDGRLLFNSDRPTVPGADEPHEWPPVGGPSPALYTNIVVSRRILAGGRCRSYISRVLLRGVPNAACPQASSG